MGKPQDHAKLTPSQVEHVWAKIERGEPDACWRWTAKSVDKKGRGKVRVNKRLYHVPRLLWELKNGPLPEQLRVYETCWNIGCCNPAHLAAATQSEIQAAVWRHKHGEPKDRKRRVADPQTGAKVYPELDEKLRARFWSYVNECGEDECWEWMGGKTGSSGYGVFAVPTGHRKQRFLRANRVSYILANGPITPVNQVVRHTCDNPPCCNPKHLILGSQVQNTADRKERERCNHAHHDTHGRAKLTTEQVEEIRARLRAGEEQAPIAADYGVHPTTVGDIALGKTWGDERRC